ncbi:glycosyltransferase [Nocardioides sp. STR2]|uniref:Glycosyltransferase n=1 Tax=Nocardioides pini TaxID=2975053 RepID=A0ABT4CCB8_9ACTN|nr:glycosyltransferase [Nocardioides pini]MCY4726598.1 glycosyltransferase [Nocardioides pini]
MLPTTRNSQGLRDSTSLVVSLVIYRPDVPLLRATLNSLREHPLSAILLVRNCDTLSEDELYELVPTDLKEKCGILGQGRNLGFAGGHNLALRFAFARGASHVLVTNPDLQFLPGGVEALIRLSADKSDQHLFSGILLFGSRSGDSKEQLIDSAGIVWTPDARHVDDLHGSPLGTLREGPADFQVPGITGALLGVPRAAWQQICDRSGEFFDEDFIAYREDAELGLRAGMLGIGSFVLNAPVAKHYRGSPGTSRRNPITNKLSVQNRFLLLSRHGFANRPGSITRSVLRDLVVIAAVLTRERGSLPGLKEAARGRRAQRKKRSVLLASLHSPDRAPNATESRNLRARSVWTSIAKGRTHWVVIPVYQADIEALRSTAAALADVANVVFVDDGSASLNQPIDDSSGLISPVNSGIAFALNTGILFALEHGAQVLTTLDQDSQLDGRSLVALRGYVETGRFDLVGPGTLPGVRYSSDSRGAVDEILQSGMTMRSTTITTLGLFDESLFIDGVDTEYCLRARRSGLRVGIHRDVAMEHVLGGGTSAPLFRVGPFAPLATSHGAFRRYYMNRNRCLLARRYGRTEPRWLVRTLRQTVVANILAATVETHRRDKAAASLAGLRDGLLGGFGPRPATGREWSSKGRSTVPTPGEGQRAGAAKKAQSL